ncbi:hypothetical protein OsI_25262 [Oryza sativa Indica Group]|uniref:Uncharacterized protein n=1 Tax=Oryza sativa subsp. indica TaxID=39946 RepID=B8B867_ORYSI|nr:hypothetical protein OsI_25262 [Oryza sativa Indica Group]
MLHPLCLWVLNPATGVTFALPKNHSDEIAAGRGMMMYHGKVESHAFGEISSTGVYKALRIIRFYQRQLCEVIAVDGNNQDMWRKMQGPPATICCSKQMRCVVVDGVVYFMMEFYTTYFEIVVLPVEPGSIASFNLETEKWMTVQGPEVVHRHVQDGDSTYSELNLQLSLADSGGCLVTVHNIPPIRMDLWFLTDSETERCYGTAVGTGTARYQNPSRWIWPDPTAGRVWYWAVPILSLCNTTRRTEVEGQKRNFACNNRIGRDGRAARTLEALGFSIDQRRCRLLDRRRRLLEVNSAVAAAAAAAGNDDIDAAASGKDDIDATTAAGNDEFAAAVACFNIATATATGKDDIDAAATRNDEFATAAACFNAAAAGKDEFDAAAAACFNACRNPPLTPLDCFKAWPAPLSSDPTHAGMNGRCVLVT